MWDVKLSQVVRDQFNEITEWRSQGESWLEIDGRFRAMGQSPGTNSVRTLYRQELARRRSPEREAALMWANSNYQAIRDLLDQGYDWTAILILIPPHFDSPGSIPLTRLVAEFMSVERLRSTSCQISSTTTGFDLPSGTPRDLKIQLASSNSQPEDPQTETSVAATEGVELPPSGLILDTHEQVSNGFVGGSAAKAVGKEKEKLTPHVRPFESGPELHERLMDAARKKNEMYQRSLNLPEEEREAAKILVSEAHREYDQLKVDFLHRFSDFKAKHSKLYLLATKALGCEAFEVVDAGSENAIKLQGYDRPDATGGFDEVPEPLYVRENLLGDEMRKIKDAYATDGLGYRERSPIVRLAEALCLRGEYLFRLGWHEYDTLVRLEGDDFPSPTLCNASKWHVRSRSIDLWPKLTGNEPVQPSEFERKRLTYRPDPELEKRGEWT